MFATDIAGYTSVTVPNTTKELFYRWTVVGAFEPVMRTHHGSDKCGNWGFDWDEESLAHFRRYAKIHSLLYPIWRGLLDEAQATGMPILRHPFLADPTGSWERAGYAWFIGEDKLAALRRGEMWTDHLTSVAPGGALSGFIARNNMSVALVAWMGGIAGGLGSLYALLLNGVMLGAIAGPDPNDPPRRKNDGCGTHPFHRRQACEGQVRPLHGRLLADDR
jgi:hypothetical protein